MERAEEKRQQLVDHYLDFYALAISMLRNEDDAKDAVQEALVRTLVKRHVDNPVSYCFQTVRHVAIDTIRHRLRHQPLGSLDLPDDETPSDADLIERVLTLHNELPQVLQTLVVLHDQKGYTYDDLAALTGMSKMTVRRRLKEAHLTIKDRLNDV